MVALRTIAAVAAAGFTTLAMTASGGAQDASPTRIKIASNSVEANGCHGTTQSFTTQVPDTERLDRSYHGVLDGIEVVET
jgi:hypothetical protein